MGIVVSCPFEFPVPLSFTAASERDLSWGELAEVCRVAAVQVLSIRIAALRQVCDGYL